MASRNFDRENQELIEERSQEKPHPEVSSPGSRYFHSLNSDHDSVHYMYFKSVYGSIELGLFKIFRKHTLANLS